MRLAVLYSLAPALLWLFVRIALPGGSAAAALRSSAGRLFGTRGGRRIALVFALVLVGNALECRIDPGLSRVLGVDFTPLVHGLEGDRVARLQRLVCGTLGTETCATVATLIYVPGFVATLALPLVVWGARHEDEAVAEGVRAIAWNYVLALPFYLAIPVREVAWSGLSQAVPLLEDFWLGLTSELRAGSALDNCLPSLHTSLAASLCFVSLRRGPQALTRLLVTATTAIVAATLVLGIHWLTDIAIALPFAVLCARLSRQNSRR